MTDADETRKVFEEALEVFPYPNLKTTGVTEGELHLTANDAGDPQDMYYGEELTFDAGNLLDENLVGGGWIDLRCDYDEVFITAFFVVARNGDFKNQRILGDNEGLLGEYDFDKREWAFSIDKI